MSKRIEHVAVLGAGTMGAAIAAHCANAGLAVDLLDLDAGVAEAGFKRVRAARPAAFMSDRLAERVRVGGFDRDLGRLGEAGWVVEAIVERLEPKRELLAKVERVANDDALLTSNTSGLPLASIAEGRSESLRRRFLGTHFFNPPRYLHLVELIPTADTDPEVLAAARALCEDVLGKGTVVAKDTPNFIANRLFSFAGMHDVRYAMDHGYGIEEVDALTGPLVGRPKTATFRLADQVGIDVMVGVADNLYQLVPDDESREALPAPEPLRRMVEHNLLGAKTGSGFYKRDKRDGRTVFDTIDLDSMSYRPVREPDLPVVAAAREAGDLGARLRLLLDRAGEDRGARFVRDTLLPALAYAARRVPEIADSLVDVDHAAEWGFRHEAGPFRAWDLIGLRRGAELMDAQGIEVAGWVRALLDAGHESFYRSTPGGEEVIDPRTGSYVPVEAVAGALDLAALRERDGEVAGNDSASLVDLGDGVLCLALHSPANAIDQGVLEMGRRALDSLDEERWRALVVAGEGDNFCVGANLAQVGMLAYQEAWDQVELASQALQQLCMGLRHAPKPVVAAVHGQTLGGGCELALHADRVVASAETYMGQVETAVGLVPAGGGCKELVRRLVSPTMHSPGLPVLPLLQRVFETVALSKVATSAVEARELGFLRDDDPIVLHPGRVLATARQQALGLAAGYRPPPRERDVYAAGAPALAALELGVRTTQWGGHASEHDGVIGVALARVLCGGELTAPQWVSAERFLDLEREAFIDLLHQPKTMERIQAMLTTRKPLRN